jgi:hypothetical protein
MNHLLKILNISQVDIARHANISRQAVHKGSPKTTHAIRLLINAARFNTEKIKIAREAHHELTVFLHSCDNKNL